MGSRSKFHKSKGATTPGRALLHGPRPKKPLVIGFEDAFWDVLRDLRAKKAKGEVRVFVPSTEKTKPTRKALRRITRGMARTMLEPFDADAPVPRAERRRAALAKARVQMTPKKEARA